MSMVWEYEIEKDKWLPVEDARIEKEWRGLKRNDVSGTVFHCFGDKMSVGVDFSAMKTFCFSKHKCPTGARGTTGSAGPTGPQGSSEGSLGCLPIVDSIQPQDWIVFGSTGANGFVQQFAPDMWTLTLSIPDAPTVTWDSSFLIVNGVTNTAPVHLGSNASYVFAVAGQVSFDYVATLVASFSSVVPAAFSFTWLINSITVGSITSNNAGTSWAPPGPISGNVTLAVAAGDSLELLYVLDVFNTASPFPALSVTLQISNFQFLPDSGCMYQAITLAPNFVNSLSNTSSFTAVDTAGGITATFYLSTVGQNVLLQMEPVSFTLASSTPLTYSLIVAGHTPAGLSVGNPLTISAGAAVSGSQYVPVLFSIDLSGNVDVLLSSGLNGNFLSGTTYKVSGTASWIE